MAGLGSWLQGVAGSDYLLWTALAAAAVVVTILRCGGKKDQAVQEILLRDLAKLWAKKGGQTIHIAELSPLWRQRPAVPGEQEPVDLNHPRAIAFMENIRQWPWFEKFPLQRAVCGQLLKLLDREGQCSSVVNISGDVEGNWDENTYQLLAKTTLLDHSLNVAELVVRLLSENKAWHVIPDTLVGALAHDLGKLQSMRGYLYSLGEHPLAAGRPLAGIAEFNALPKKDEILRAIKLHHKMARGLLGKTLKKADQLARQQELEETVLQNGAAPRVSDTPVMDAAPRKTKQTTAAARRAQADIYPDNGGGEPGKSASVPPKLMDISAWFDGPRFLAGLQPYINKMYGHRFLAFSMPNGYVYFQVKVLEGVARKEAERNGCMEIATMAQGDETMRRVLLSIVHHLRTEHEVIARGLIKDNFFGGYFTVTRRLGSSLRGYYTPFHAEPFGSLAEMERGKPAGLRDIVRVCPYLHTSKSQDGR